MVLLLAGCSGGESGSDQADSPPETWRLVETARIGSVDGPDDAFTRVGALLPFPDGGAWFLEPTERRVRVVGPDGRLSGSVGGPGQGPGEFSAPGTMGWWNGGSDTIWVADRIGGLVSLFSKDGEFTRSLRMEPVEWGDRWGVSHPVAVTPEGVGLGLARYSPGGGTWPPSPLLAFALPDGDVVREVLTVPRTDAVQIEWRGETVATGAHPMSDAPIVAYSPSGTLIVVVSRETGPRAEGPQVRLAAIRPQGDTVWQRAIRYDPKPIPETELDELWSGGIETFQRFVALEGRLSASEAEQAYTTSVPRPAHRPPVSTVLVDAADRVLLIWSSGPGAEAQGWLINAQGDPVSAFSVPAGQDVLGFEEEMVWLIEFNDLGVPFMIRSQLERS